MGSVSLIDGHIDDDVQVTTYEEAKAWFEEDLKDGKCSDDCPECNARELAIKAFDKQIPKKPTVKKSIKVNAFTLRCPNCEAVLQADSPHCRYCGQALDWSNTEE